MSQSLRWGRNLTVLMVGVWGVCEGEQELSVGRCGIGGW